MDIALLDWLRAEAVVLIGAPVLAAGVCALGVVLGWVCAKHIDAAALDAKNATIELLNATVQSYREQAAKELPVSVASVEPPPRPNAEMLQADRMLRKQQITDWRQMVAFVNHHAKQPNVTETPIELVESDPRFMALRPWLSEQTKRALRGQTDSYNAGLHTLPFALRCILDDIDEYERKNHLA